MKTLREIIINTDIQYIKNNLIHTFSGSNEKCAEVVGVYIDNLVRQIHALDSRASDAFAIFVPVLDNGVIKDTLFFLSQYESKFHPIIDEWEHLIPATYPEDNIYEQDEDPSAMNILTMSEAEAHNYLTYECLLPPRKHWKYDMDFEKMLASPVINSDRFTESLIACQWIENFMYAEGFTAPDINPDDVEELWLNSGNIVPKSNINQLFSAVSIYHTLRACSGIHLQ